jgi:hypothetical protein
VKACGNPALVFNSGLCTSTPCKTLNVYRYDLFITYCTVLYIGSVLPVRPLKLELITWINGAGSDLILRYSNIKIVKFSKKDCHLLQAVDRRAGQVVQVHDPAQHHGQNPLRISETGEHGLAFKVDR